MEETEKAIDTQPASEPVSEKKTNKKIVSGVVKSDKMTKTIVVEVASRRLHPLYKKYVTQTKRIKAHDEKEEAHVGDTVRVIEARRVSKEKAWRLSEIVERAR